MTSRPKPYNRGRRLIFFLIIAIGIMVLVDRVISPTLFPEESVKQKDSPAQTVDQALQDTGWVDELLPQKQEVQVKAQKAEHKTEIASTSSSSLKPLPLEPVFDPKLPEEKFMPFEDWLTNRQAALANDIFEKAREASFALKQHLEEKAMDNAHYLNGDVQPPSWREFAAFHDKNNTTPKVIVIIDDLGERKDMTRKFTDLPGPLTLSFLPYVSRLQPMIDKARAQSHEVMLHIPMEPVKSSIYAGPKTLTSSMSRAEIQQNLLDNLGRAHGYVGINNHMGSKVTQDSSAMDSVMRILLNKGLLFIDSRTINKSVALKYARLNGVPSETRDIFIDHHAESDFIEKQLAKTEEIAKRKGFAIAIGHPYPETFDALTKWLPGLKDKGLVLSPVTSVIQAPKVSAVSAEPEEISPADKDEVNTKAKIYTPLRPIPVKAAR